MAALPTLTIPSISALAELEPTLFSKYYGMPQVKGTIKQIGDNSCAEVIITFEFSNGSIKDEGLTSPAYSQSMFMTLKNT